MTTIRRIRRDFTPEEGSVYAGTGQLNAEQEAKLDEVTRLLAGLRNLDINIASQEAKLDDLKNKRDIFFARAKRWFERELLPENSTLTALNDILIEGETVNAITVSFD